jgi:hypothetical protein
MKTKPGDSVTYRSFGDDVRRGTVTSSSDNIKNDEPGFTMITPNGEEYWGYDYQIITHQAH